MILARFSLGPQVTYPVAAGEVYRVGVWVKAGADFQMDPGSPRVGNPLEHDGRFLRPFPRRLAFTFIYLNSAVSQAGPPDYSPLPVPPIALTNWTHIDAVVKVPAGIDHLVPGLFFLEGERLSLCR